MDELKPCPFCGGEVKLASAPYTEDVTLWYVICRECEIMTLKRPSQEKARRAWNRRAKDLVQVVRCKDCVYYNNNRQLFDDDICEIMYYCDGTHRTVCERDYCSMGVRKEDCNND